MKKILMLIFMVLITIETSFAGMPIATQKATIETLADINLPTNLSENPTKKTRKERKVLRKQIRQIVKARKSGDNWIVAMLLSYFVGIFGIDRFYLGYTGLGILKLLTFGGLGIWALIDFIRIIIKDLKPKGGEYTN